jgi:hypothetical protein
MMSNLQRGSPNIFFYGSSWWHGSWIYNYLCNQCLSPIKMWVWIPLMARCTRYNIVWWSLSVTLRQVCDFCKKKMLFTSNDVEFANLNHLKIATIVWLSIGCDFISSIFIVATFAVIFSRWTRRLFFAIEYYKYRLFNWPNC